MYFLSGILATMVKSATVDDHKQRFVKTRSEPAIDIGNEDSYVIL